MRIRSLLAAGLGLLLAAAIPLYAYGVAYTSEGDEGLHLLIG